MLANTILNCSLQKLNSAIVYDRDFQYQYFGFKVSIVPVSRFRRFVAEHVEAS